ncbi:MAG TPA: hypothetical protein VHF08_03455 [Nitrososphaeraceae archaeon]|nr:hypothetical protein [Nitrososphaeraceae archaeon]
MLPTTKTILDTKSLLISTTTGLVIVSIAVLILGLLVDKKIESIMILHDFYIVLAIMIGAGFIGVLLFGNNNDVNQRDSAVNILKYISIIATISVFAIVITGTIGYIEYRITEIHSAKSIIIRTFPFAHNVMFETMEYAGLIGPLWSTLITYITFHYREQIFTNIAARNSLVIMISLAIIYSLIISLTGIVPTKIASVQG